MGVRIRQAETEDREQVVRLLDEAFHHDPVSGWVFPDEAHRRAVHGKFLGVFVDVTLAEGRIDLLEDGTAVALWLPVPAGAPTEEDTTPALMRATADPDNERAELVGRLTGAIHPHDRAHEYLLMIGVSPDRQGEGIGAALIADVLERCDRDGVPAYLEASSARSRRLYERLGFAFMGATVELPDGPSMWPMWREPQVG
ncbi:MULTISPECIES: GNAT family N-acetyltransferase [Streptomyces]|jgi:GNAT superfamily N-acetyltransferase|uniref:GNAT family N-acetyltransferase n=1 Tax=unclassified Streptomyces TaxID=2593676 RepID=UPI0008811856|nr:MULTISPECIES: GNAT family N-acetyltransferase [unclassified Streptomyces]MDX2732499.1 GNAT family N-acetyltransferase [Streptomyces sp. PA03-2a]MDX3765725.1 GNAT family N-acetyltransferase [Streptomyces sp. AK08-01B]MDX3816102.1 GNAT family N-acetyltransferase [Streptomyces sp. AK08-01A]SCY51545.1 Acetyltransferase (GNAT) family protein [Streptomyces sp. 136MFCol5.1]SFS61994.1 Acetyltransferase (GNAT) family protein [Streptomyces sp. ok210]